MLPPIVMNKSEIKIIGISIRTNNKNEMSGNGKIGSQWQKFYEQNVESQIPNKSHPGTVHAIYTDYESDENGEYSFILGAEVRNFDNIPQGMVAKTIPASKYAVYTSRRGPMPDIIFEIWKHIWNLKSGYKRAYLGDFEVYDSRSKDPNDAIVDVYLSITESV